jgi:hypothetical protein
MKQVICYASLVEGDMQNNIGLFVLLLSACFKTNFKTLAFDYQARMLKATEDPSEKPSSGTK